MSHSLFGKIIIWSLIIVCFGSFGSGTGRAVVCLEQNGEVTLSLLHNDNQSHCFDDHLHTRQRRQQQLTSLILSSNRCHTCNDFEVSLHLFAPRNEHISTIINFIARPQFTAGLRVEAPQSAPTLAPRSSRPTMIDPSFPHLQSTILLI